MRDILSLLDAGNKAQLEKLKENEHKKGFDDCNLEYVDFRLSEEIDEYKDEMCKKNKDYSAIIKELADIANFCHMGILTCDSIIKENR